MGGGVRAALHWLPWCVSCMLAAASALSMNGMDWRRPAFRAECRAPWMDMNMIACCRYAIHPVRAATLAWRALASRSILSPSYRPGEPGKSAVARGRAHLVSFHST